jgi:hypothetical protein
MATGAKLFLIRGELPDDPIARGYRWSLYVVKVGATGSKAYVAFRTPGAARMIADQSPLLSVVEVGELNEQYSHDFSGTAVLLLDSAAEVVKFLKDRKAYPFEEHLYMYSAETGLRKLE